MPCKPDFSGPLAHKGAYLNTHPHLLTALRHWFSSFLILEIHEPDGCYAAIIKNFTDSEEISIIIQSNFT